MVPAVLENGSRVSAAAKMLKGEAAFAMVDTFVEQELREKYNLHEYPMLYFFIGGVKLYHSGSRRRCDLIFN